MLKFISRRSRSGQQSVRQIFRVRIILIAISSSHFNCVLKLECRNLQLHVDDSFHIFICRFNLALHHRRRILKKNLRFAVSVQVFSVLFLRMFVAFP